MEERVYTEKQLALLRAWQAGELKRINLLTGSVRSGKTWISLVLWAFFVATMPKNGAYLMAGRTLSTLKRNCLDLLESLVGARNFSYSITKKEARLFSRKVFLEGAPDARSEGKLRGLTLSGAYMDELTLFDHSFFAMLLSRLSNPGAKLFATTNPDSPTHWLYKDYILRADELDLWVEQFSILDNSFLPKDYVEHISKEYTGVFYDRFILGQWKRAEGAIYREFADNPAVFTKNLPDDGDILFASVGVDFGGNKSAHAFVLNGLTKDFQTLVTLDEFYHLGPLSPQELEAQFVAFLKRNARYRIDAAWCDSAETTLILGLQNAVAKAGIPVPVRKAKKGRILERIRFFVTMMDKGRYKIAPHATHTIDALKNAVWAESYGQDTRRDDGTTNVDSLDALEYAAEPYMRDMMDMGAIF